MTRIPELPPAYRLVALDTVDDVVAETHRRAADDAEDGTLVWASAETGEGTRQGNLRSAIILRPDDAAAATRQFPFIAGLALFDAINAHVAPGYHIHCLWPGGVLIQEKKVADAAVETAPDSDAPPEWLVLAFEAYIEAAADGAPYPTAALGKDFAGKFDAIDMLESVSRHLLPWINDWLDGGFPAVRKSWLQRAWGRDENIKVNHGGEVLSGTFAGVDDDGALILQTGAGEHRIGVGDGAIAA